MRRSSWVLGIVLVLATPSAASALEVQWGRPGDMPVPADFDGDGYADYVTWRPANGRWYVMSSATSIPSVVQWGVAGDTPVPGDYDDDGVMDFAVWRPSDGHWYVKSGATGAQILDFWWGTSSAVPVPGDYNGDGRLDLAYWQPSTGVWMVNGVGGVYSKLWGQSGDVPVPGDYDGVAGDDFAIWRPSTGEWWTLGGKTGVVGPIIVQPGAGSDIPSTARFCTDTVSRTLWVPSTGVWSTLGQPPASLGGPGYTPVAANFFGDGAAEHAVWRAWNGTWYVQESPCDRWLQVKALADAALADVPGVTIAVVQDGNIVFAHGAGTADGVFPASPDQPWQLASISKLFVATAVLTVIDDGLLHPDDPAGLINRYNGLAPTLRQLANHTSSVSNAWCVSAISNPLFDPPADLAHVTTCLCPTVLKSCSKTLVGPDPFAMWIDREPGAGTTYSNIGAAWPARMVELATGIDFATYTRDRIFTPLAMTATAWFAADLPGQTLAAGYDSWGSPTNEYGSSPYPAGNLRASALDLARFMIMWTNDGEAFGVRVLAPGTVATALTNTGNGFGFFWVEGSTIGGHSTWWHNGIFQGVCTKLSIDPVRREGVVVLTNGPCAQWGTSPLVPKADKHIPRIEDQAYRTLGWL